MLSSGLRSRFYDVTRISSVDRGFPAGLAGLVQKPVGGGVVEDVMDLEDLLITEQAVLAQKAVRALEGQRQGGACVVKHAVDGKTPQGLAGGTSAWGWGMTLWLNPACSRFLYRSAANLARSSFSVIGT